MQQHGSKYFACRSDRGQGGGRGSKFNFSEHGHAAYQIKGNHECNNMVANILPADPHAPSDRGGGAKRSKIIVFRTHSCCKSN